VDVSRIPAEYDKGLKRYTLSKKYYSNNPNNGVEAYVATLTNRYFTFTGNILQDGNDVDQTDEFLQFLELYMVRNMPVTPALTHIASSVLTDEQILEKARRAKNREKFIALFDNGDISSYKSDSEADLALMNILAFWTCCDYEQMERLFGESALAERDKWDRESCRVQSQAKSPVCRRKSERNQHRAFNQSTGGGG
jgi:putative DNA primase/helicase